MRTTLNIPFRAIHAEHLFPRNPRNPRPLFRSDRFFVIKEPLLAPAAAAVAAERPVGADDAVTGDEDGDLVLAVDAPNRADGAGRTHAARHVGVGPRLAIRDLAECLPGRQLERGAALLQRQIEVAPRAGEILAQLLRRPSKDRMVARNDRSHLL